MKEATTGLSVKMFKIDYEWLDEGTSESQLENNVEVETFISKISTHLLKYDMRKIFKAFPILEAPLLSEATRWASHVCTDDQQSDQSLGRSI